MGTIILIGLCVGCILFCIGIKLFYVDEKSNYEVPVINYSIEELDSFCDQDLVNAKICKNFLCENLASNTGLVPDSCDSCLTKTYGL